jgi:hypothetical protein
MYAYPTEIMPEPLAHFLAWRTIEGLALQAQSIVNGGRKRTGFGF